MAEKRAYLASLWHSITRYKFALLAAAAGLLLLLWPSAGREQAPDTQQAQTCALPAEDTAAEEEKLSALLSLIEGAGEVRVMLTLRSGGEWVYADEKKLSTDQNRDARRTESQTQYVILRDSAGGERLVPVRQASPQYRGALVVSRGAGNATVRLALVEAVKAVTGLPSERITVVKMG